jgi:hypothetical protein
VTLFEQCICSWGTIAIGLPDGQNATVAGTAHRLSSSPSGSNKTEVLMKIRLTTVFVDDQDNALKFYTEVLGSVKKQDFAHLLFACEQVM